MKLLTMDVVIPAFNEENEIEECLRHLISQQKDLNKIIVVDNNSTDNTVKIVKKVQKECRKIILLHEKTPGVIFARNKGFNFSKADIIGRIDADTRVQPGWANEARQFISRHPQLAGVSGLTNYYDLPWKRICDFFSWFSVFFANEVAGGAYSFYGANMAIRRKVWCEIKNDIYDDQHIKIMEDLSISLACQKKGYKIGWAKFMEADVSGRRFRMSPREFYKYNARWWQTYLVHGSKSQAYFTRFVSCYIANAVQLIGSTIFRFHDPKTGKWAEENFHKNGWSDRTFQ